MANTRDQFELTPALIDWEKRVNGLNQSEIAKKYGYSRSWVSQVKHTTDRYLRSPRESVMEHFPWELPADLDGASPGRRIKEHMEYMDTGGEGMSFRKLKRLQGFYRRLLDNNVVVEYDPRFPPIEGVSNHGGFAYQPREGKDGDLIIRVNKYTTMTPEAWRLLRMPPDLPQL